MKRDPVYRENQKQSQADWLSHHGDYWKQYRAKHPEQTAHNRALQKVRNKRRRLPRGVGMDASIPCKSSAESCLPGSFWLVALIAKMDAIKVYLHMIPDI
jgi:hypothetical protein